MAPSRPGLTGPNAVRVGLAGAAVIGVICLVSATFATVIEVKVGTTTRVPDHDIRLGGWERHGPALLIIALVAAAMIVGALRGGRPAMAALAVLGLAALLIAIIGDVPDLHTTGFVGAVYEDAAAGPKAGFYLETLGAVLLLAAGALMFVMAGAGAATADRRGAHAEA